MKLKAKRHAKQQENNDKYILSYARVKATCNKTKRHA